MENPTILSRLAVPGGGNEALLDIATLKSQMAESFHLYQEVQALSAKDRDFLFEILLLAQSGDPEILRDIHSLVYDEIPVGMEEFVCSKKYLNIGTQINPEKVELLCTFARPTTRKFWCAAGSGGGKSFMVSIAMAWMVYTLLCLKKPDMFYMLGPKARIAVINMSVGKDQAKDVIFAEFLGRLEHAPYFKGKYKALASRAIFSKRVYVFSGGSGVTSYFGYNTIMGSLDECSHMFDKTDRSVAEDLTEALLKSLTTRFPNSYKLFAISTLRAPDDFLNTQIQRIKEEGHSILYRPLQM